MCSVTAANDLEGHDCVSGTNDVAATLSWSADGAKTTNEQITVEDTAHQQTLTGFQFGDKPSSIPTTVGGC